MKITSQEIRETFLDFFHQRGHLLIPNTSLVPINDPTLLLINSGMAPLKSLFTGDRMAPQPRLCNIQRCVRTNDIESVGDPHHLTFFEMMGNWSIGDYFKEEAITMAWHLIKDVFGFDTSRICATVYAGDTKHPDVPADDESRRIWSSLLPVDRIIPLGADSNLWGPAGVTGPCGPCTEVFFDRGKDHGCDQNTCGPDCSCGRFLEIWNAGVFMEYYLHEDKSLTVLPIKSVDAGAGLDRFAVILQGADSVYETDLLHEITEMVSSQSNLDHRSKSVRIVTDHLRCSAFLINDGVRPANTRKEYVLRRLLRRAAVHAKLLNLDDHFRDLTIRRIVDLSTPYYPTLTDNQELILSVVGKEMHGFEQTLRRGLRELDKIIGHSTGQIITGQEAFRLHDTLGLPLEIMRDVAETRGFTVDEKGYNSSLEIQRRKSR